MGRVANLIPSKGLCEQIIYFPVSTVLLTSKGTQAYAPRRAIPSRLHTEPLDIPQSKPPFLIREGGSRPAFRIVFQDHIYSFQQTSIRYSVHLLEPVPIYNSTKGKKTCWPYPGCTWHSCESQEAYYERYRPLSSIREKTDWAIHWR